MTKPFNNTFTKPPQQGTYMMAAYQCILHTNPNSDGRTNLSFRDKNKRRVQCFTAPRLYKIITLQLMILVVRMICQTFKKANIQEHLQDNSTRTKNRNMK